MNDHYRTQTVVRPNKESILATNSVIRNTYMLLSATLIFSAITAGISMAINAQMSGLFTMVLAFGFLFITQALRNSIWGLVSIFAFTGLMGFSLGPLLNAYIHGFSNGPQLVSTALGLTGVIFLSLSGYALTTQKDFSYLRGFLFSVMCVLLVASMIGIFLNIPILHLGISCGVVLIMSGYILYDTSLIINGGQRNYIMATIGLYLSIYNLFVHLLRILAFFAGRRD